MGVSSTEFRGGATYRQSEVSSEFLFPFLDRRGPRDRLSLLVVGGDTCLERGFSRIGTENVIGLHVLALKPAEPDVDLSEPGGVGRQPKRWETPSEIAVTRVFAEPAFPLRRRVHRPGIHKEDHRFDVAPQRFRDDHRWHIDKTRAASAGSVNCAIGHGTSSKQMAHAATTRNALRGEPACRDRLTSLVPWCTRA